MEIQGLATIYQQKSDEELLLLAASAQHLTPEAHLALKRELARRGIAVKEKFQNSQEEDAHGAAKASAHLPVPVAVGRFMAEVVRTYHSQFWLFMGLTAPAVILGYIAVITARRETSDILRHLPRGVEMLKHHRELMEVQFLNLAGYFVSWTAGCFSFAAVSSAMVRLASGVVPSFSDCFIESRERPGSLFRLALLLFVLMVAAMAVSMLVSAGLIWFAVQSHVQVTQLAILIESFILVGLTFLVLSRFGLAIPALVLDKLRVGQSMFRSDELTEGKWLTLAVLLIKSLAGAYVAGMLPYWLASWLLTGVPVPWWTGWALDIASVIGVTLIEPVMFIGFSLLYLQTSAASSTSDGPLVSQLA